MGAKLPQDFFVSDDFFIRRIKNIYIEMYIHLYKYGNKHCFCPFFFYLLTIYIMVNEDKKYTAIFGYRF